MQWIAIYNDGSKHMEEELKSTDNVDRTQLKQFQLFNDSKLVFNGFFDNDRKLIFRRRTYLDMSGNQKGIVYLVGWHMNVSGKSIKSICYVYEDGHIEFDDSRDDLELTPKESYGE